MQLCSAFPSLTVRPIAECLSLAAFTRASTSRQKLLSSASQYDGPHLARLEANAVAATSHATADVAALIVAVQQCGPTFVSNARQHARGVEKRLCTLIEGFAGVQKTLASFAQHIGASDYTLEFTEESVSAVTRILETLADLPDLSIMIASPLSDASQRTVAESSLVVTGIDSSRSTVSHARWLARGQANIVKISVVDNKGTPVYGVTDRDVMATVSSDSEGWSVSSVVVDADTMNVEVLLVSECSEASVLRVEISGSVFTIPLQVSRRRVGFAPDVRRRVTVQLYQCYWYYIVVFLSNHEPLLFLTLTSRCFSFAGGCVPSDYSGSASRVSAFGCRHQQFRIHHTRCHVTARSVCACLV